MSNGRYVQTSVESVYGDGGSTFTAMICNSVSDPVDKNPLYEEPIHTNVKSQAFGGPLKLSGSLEGNLRPKMMQDLLEAIYGVKTANAGDDNVFTIGDGKSLAMKVGEQTGSSSSELLYTGVGIKSVGLNCEAKEFVKVTADWFAKDVTKGTYAEPTYDTEDPVLFSGAVLKVAGTAIASRSVELSFGRNYMDDNFVIGSSTMYGLMQQGHSDITGTIKFPEDEFDEVNRAVFGTVAGTSVPACNQAAEVQLDLEFTRACAGSVGMTWSIPTALYKDTSRRIQGRNEIEKSIGFEVLGEDMSATVIDGAL